MTQFTLGGSLLGIPADVRIGALDLQLPMIAAAVGFWALMLTLLWTMAEAGYSPRRLSDFQDDRSARLV